MECCSGGSELAVCFRRGSDMFLLFPECLVVVCLYGVVREGSVSWVPELLIGGLCIFSRLFLASVSVDLLVYRSLVLGFHGFLFTMIGLA